MIFVKVTTDNVSFTEDYSKTVNHILLQVQDIANKIEEGGVHLPVTLKLMDGNGNHVGQAKFTK